ncbi:hypothetical protein JCM19294_2096 [Nonlabens tegetincola]|uniref:Uncharacterized protein n=1 Tax=Nonlabens tegetincola TaxID=323273 RepID=A0A090Q4B3_9FLAO|nr:hypothetical protein JCM19294_2096 [Nonlabens tegetincola]
MANRRYSEMNFEEVRGISRSLLICEAIRPRIKIIRQDLLGYLPVNVNP